MSSGKYNWQCAVIWNPAENNRIIAAILIYFIAIWDAFDLIFKTQGGD